jgi:hypothetical protein
VVLDASTGTNRAAPRLSLLRSAERARRSGARKMATANAILIISASIILVAIPELLRRLWGTNETGPVTAGLCGITPLRAYVNNTGSRSTAVARLFVAFSHSGT